MHEVLVDFVFAFLADGDADASIIWSVTSDDIDEIVETNAAIALVCAFEGSLEFTILGFGQDAPLLVEEFFEVEA